MKNKKIINGLALSALALSAVTVPIAVNADENDGIETNEEVVNTTESVDTDTKKSEKATLQLGEGDLTLETSPITSFGSHQIEKEKKTATAAFNGEFFVTDARGTQAGWDLTVSATPFTIVEPVGGWVKENVYSLPMGSFSLNNLVGLNGVYGENASLYPVAQQLGVAIDLGQEVKIASASKGTGMGRYAFDFGQEALSLVIDPTTAKIDKVNYPDSVTPYESTITWNLVSGPGTETVGTVEEDVVESAEVKEIHSSFSGNIYDNRETETLTKTLTIPGLKNIVSIEADAGNVRILSIEGDVVTYEVTDIPIKNYKYNVSLLIKFQTN